MRLVLLIASCGNNTYNFEKEKCVCGGNEDLLCEEREYCSVEEEDSGLISVCLTACLNPAWDTTTASNKNLVEVFGADKYFMGTQNISCIDGYFEPTTQNKTFEVTCVNGEVPVEEIKFCVKEPGKSV